MLRISIFSLLNQWREVHLSLVTASVSHTAANLHPLAATCPRLRWTSDYALQVLHRGRFLDHTFFDWDMAKSSMMRVSKIPVCYHPWHLPARCHCSRLHLVGWSQPRPPPELERRVPQKDYISLELLYRESRFRHGSLEGPRRRIDGEPERSPKETPLCHLVPFRSPKHDILMNFALESRPGGDGLMVIVSIDSFLRWLHDLFGFCLCE